MIGTLHLAAPADAGVIEETSAVGLLSDSRMRPIAPAQARPTPARDDEPADCGRLFGVPKLLQEPIPMLLVLHLKALEGREKSFGFCHVAAVSPQVGNDLDLSLNMMPTKRHVAFSMV